MADRRRALLPAGRWVSGDGFESRIVRRPTVPVPDTVRLCAPAVHGGTVLHSARAGDDHGHIVADRVHGHALLAPRDERSRPYQIAADDPEPGSWRTRATRAMPSDTTTSAGTGWDRNRGIDSVKP